MKDFLENNLAKGDNVVFIHDNALKEGVIVGGGSERATILSTKRIIDESIKLQQNEEGKWYSTWKDVPHNYSISFCKIYRKKLHRIS